MSWKIGTGRFFASTPGDLKNLNVRMESDTVDFMAATDAVITHPTGKRGRNMNNVKRSSCKTCEKEKGAVNIMSFAEALHHCDNNPTHHVFINPDFEQEINTEDFNAA